MYMRMYTSHVRVHICAQQGAGWRYEMLHAQSPQRLHESGQRAHRAARDMTGKKMPTSEIEEEEEFVSACLCDQCGQLMRCALYNC